MNAKVNAGTKPKRQSYRRKSEDDFGGGNALINRAITQATVAKRPKLMGDKAVQDAVRQSLTPSEEDSQIALMEWAEMTYRMYDSSFKDGETLADYIHHSPNGGKRERKTSANGPTYCPEGEKLKKMGTKAGFPDLTVFLARGGYFGLYIEMKRERGGTTSREQRQLIERLQRQGYLCAVCHGTMEAIKVLKTYMNFPNTITKKMEFNSHA